MTVEFENKSQGSYESNSDPINNSVSSWARHFLSHTLPSIQEESWIRSLWKPDPNTCWYKSEYKTALCCSSRCCMLYPLIFLFLPSPAWGAEPEKRVSDLSKYVLESQFKPRMLGPDLSSFHHVHGTKISVKHAAWDSTRNKCSFLQRWPKLIPKEQMEWIACITFIWQHRKEEFYWVRQGGLGRTFWVHIRVGLSPTCVASLAVCWGSACMSCKDHSRCLPPCPWDQSALNEAHRK